MTRTKSDLTATLDALQQTLAALTARVARLESQLVDVYAHEDEDQSLEDSAGRDQVVVGSDASSRRPGETAQADMSRSASGPSLTMSRADAIPLDVMLAISAAVAAYLGERAHVKQIRLIGSQAWGRQGRVSVQASHTLYR